jgi:hypothetical protein
MRQTIIDLQASRIRDVANAGLGRSDVLAFWFGEDQSRYLVSFLRESEPQILELSKNSGIEIKKIGKTCLVV